RSSSRASRARPGSCSATSCTPRAPDPRLKTDRATGKAAERRPFLFARSNGRSAVGAGRLRRPAPQRLPAFGGVDAAILVEVAAGEVALGAGHELGLADEAVLVAVEQPEVAGLPPHLGIARQHVAGRRRRAGEQLVLAELAVLVDIELPEARFLP